MWITYDPSWVDHAELAAALGDNPAGAEAVQQFPVEFLLGLTEGLGDVGRTYDGDPESLRSVAYDTGRTTAEQLRDLRLILAHAERSPWTGLADADDPYVRRAAGIEVTS